jgi:hypothetical protein
MNDQHSTVKLFFTLLSPRPASMRQALISIPDMICRSHLTYISGRSSTGIHGPDLARVFDWQQSKISAFCLVRFSRSILKKKTVEYQQLLARRYAFA